MKVNLAYGRDGLEIRVPDTADVLETRYVPGLPDEAGALLTALRQPIGSPPLAELVKPGDRVVVVHTDITRATPNERILPVLLAELESAGVARGDITLLNGLAPTAARPRLSCAPCSAGGSSRITAACSTTATTTLTWYRWERLPAATRCASTEHTWKPMPAS